MLEKPAKQLFHASTVREFNSLVACTISLKALHLLVSLDSHFVFSPMLSAPFLFTKVCAVKVPKRTYIHKGLWSKKHLRQIVTTWDDFTEPPYCVLAYMCLILTSSRQFLAFEYYLGVRLDLKIGEYSTVKKSATR